MKLLQFLLPLLFHRGLCLTFLRKLRGPLEDQKEVFKRMAREALEEVRAEESREEAVPFGDMVANEPLAYQAVLEKLKPYYPQIRRFVARDTQKNISCVLSRSEPDGIWSTPEPTYILPWNNQRDRYGYFWGFE